MRNLDEIAKRGDGLRPELKSLYERLAKDPCSDRILRGDGMIQAGPNPDKEPSACGKLNERVRDDGADSAD